VRASEMFLIASIVEDMSCFSRVPCSTTMQASTRHMDDPPGNCTHLLPILGCSRARCSSLFGGVRFASLRDLGILVEGGTFT